MDLDHQRRIQRRELKNYQQLFMLLNSLDIIGEDIKKAFACITGPVWKRYNDATKGASEGRITVLFLSNELNGFDELLFVGCHYVKRHQHKCCTLWADHPSGEWISESCLVHVTRGLAGRSVVSMGQLHQAGRINRGPVLGQSAVKLPIDDGADGAERGIRSAVTCD